MRKSKLKYLFISIGLFIILILFQHYSPKPIDWRMSFDRNHDAPYGCYVLNKMYPEIFTDSIMYNTDILINNPFLDTMETDKRNLILITDNFNPDDEEVNALMQFVEAGNTAFLSFNGSAYRMMKRLKMHVRRNVIDTAYLKTAKDTLNFYNPMLKKDSGYVFNNRLMTSYLVLADSCKATILGHDRQNRIDFVRIKIGDGAVFIQTQPLVFTNIHLLYSDPDYVLAALSYLPDQPTIIDRFYKPYKMDNTSPTSFLLSEPPLRAAFYLVVLLLVLYIVFGSRRKQKAIPVIESLHFP
jgi:hypothetical protein